MKSFSFCLLITFWGFSALPAEDALQPEKGEKKLDAEEGEVVLGEIKASFSKYPCLRAKVVNTVEDPLGLIPMEEHGEVLIRRPDSVLRRFVKDGKSIKAVLLSAQLSKTFNASSEQVVLKDYSSAPKRLALVRAGGTGDLDVLRRYYDVTVFEKVGSGGKQWRLVLDHCRGPLPYKRMQARIEEGQALFSEIQYEYKNAADGDNKTETFSDIKTAAQLADSEFNDPVFDGAEVVKEAVEELRDE